VSDEGDTWVRYFAAAGDAPRDTLLHALELHEAEGRSPGTAVDLGCGGGRDALELLRRGWRVLAVDAEPAAIDLILGRADARAALETVVARFGDVDLPQADLVNASFSLPFCPADEFERTWASIRGALGQGGRFCGQLFGERDAWAPGADMNFHSRQQVELLLDGLVVERLDEVDAEGPTALEGLKHWHLFHVVARRP